MRLCQKNTFKLNDYKFKIVKMEFLHSNIENQTNGWFYFLVDDNNFIHDYRIEFKTLNITNLTTKSHWNSPKSLSIEFITRDAILKFLKLEHKPNEITNKHKKYTYINDKNIINNLNQYIYECIPWRNITIPNVEYIITGSNPSGQGNGKSTFLTKFNNTSFPYGFFTNVLNISKKINKKYQDISYKSIWGNSLNDLYKNNEIQIIEFNDWINQNNNLWSILTLFKINSKNWKELKNNFTNKFKKEWQKFNKLDNLIRKYRREQTIALKKKFSSCELFESINEYFLENKELSESIEVAHIYPVWKIKEEYIEKEDESILEMIADVNNCLPLSRNIHSLYDNKYFYWDYKTGIMKTLKNSKDKTIKNYNQINPEKLKYLSKYLKNYQKKIIKII